MKTLLGTLGGHTSPSLGYHVACECYGFHADSWVFIPHPSLYPLLAFSCCVSAFSRFTAPFQGASKQDEVRLVFGGDLTPG